MSADYVITAESGGWRIVDAVAGRDGSTWVTSIERLRYSDNATQTLTYPAAFVGGGVKDAGAALVIPALDGGHDGGWAWSDGFDGAFRPADVSVCHPHDPWG